MIQTRLGSYRDLINGFLSKGYTADSFFGADRREHRLIIRHDIDFDCGYAYKIALIENDLGVKGSYFFLLRSDSYNLLSPENADYVRRIRDDGHTVSIHFDPTIYENDFLNGFASEREIFEKTFDVKISIISLHRPNDFFLDYNEPLGDVEHTYQTKYFREIKYISDSQGSFRYGHPFETEEFQAGKTIHLLTHPIWWVGEGESNIAILKNHISERQMQLDLHFAKNCIPYQNYLMNK